MVQVNLGALLLWTSVFLLATTRRVQCSSRKPPKRSSSDSGGAAKDPSSALKKNADTTKAPAKCNINPGVLYSLIGTGILLTSGIGYLGIEATYHRRYKLKKFFYKNWNRYILNRDWLYFHNATRRTFWRKYPDRIGSLRWLIIIMAIATLVMASYTFWRGQRKRKKRMKAAAAKREEASRMGRTTAATTSSINSGIFLPREASSIPRVKSTQAQSSGRSSRRAPSAILSAKSKHLV